MPDRLLLPGIWVPPTLPANVVPALRATRGRGIASESTVSDALGFAHAHDLWRAGLPTVSDPLDIAHTTVAITHAHSL